VRRFRRVGKSWLSWSNGRVHFGWSAAGKCWRWRYTRTLYFAGHKTWHQFGRLFLSIDHRVPND
jgi:hypothetical protein